MPGSLGPLDLVGVQIPWYFRCPISLELMGDPVTVSTGQTYDRPSIESWVATGNTTCPVTRAPLAADTPLIPNHTLRRLIQEWCVAHRSLGVERIPTPKQPADPSLVRHLLHQSSQETSPAADRLAALRRLRSVARESDKNRSLLATRETKSALLAIAFDEPNSDLSSEAMAVLASLPFSEAEGAELASQPERVSRLALVVSTHRSMEARISAATILESASSAARVEVGESEGVVEGLVALLEIGTGHRAARAGVRGLFALSLAKENRTRAVSAGATAAVVRRLDELNNGDAERALATLELLCRVEAGRGALMAEGPPAIRALVGAMSGKASERAAEHAAGALVAVLSGDETLQREAVSAGVVTQLLLMVQSGCSDRARRKAQLLLKLLRAAWPQYCSDSLAANSDEFNVHAWNS